MKMKGKHKPLAQVLIERSHWVCTPAYLVPVPSQNKLGGLQQEGHPE